MKPHHDSVSNRQAPNPLKHLLKFAGVFALVWLVFAGAWSGFPELKPGHQQVLDEKLSWLKSESIFSKDTAVRVVVFGSSKVLAGFIPETFDQLSSGRVESVNFGLPDHARYVVSNLERMVAQRTIPTHVVLTQCLRSSVPLESQNERDVQIIESLFPFRRLARNVIEFSVRSWSAGGAGQFLDDSRRQIQALRRYRGYHFIADQSIYPMHQLPNDFRSLKDQPEQQGARDCGATGPEFLKLQAMQRQFGFRVLFVPVPIRPNRYAKAPEKPRLNAAFEGSSVEVLGPDYWRFSNRYFSDPAHLNRAGASLYTQRLWALLQPELLSNMNVK